MRKVEAKVWDEQEKKLLPKICHFHAWGQEADGEGQSNPVAIVELEDGQVATVWAPNVKFLEPLAARDQ
jgi:hypothetical protein